MEQQEFYDEWYKQILKDGQMSVANILRYAPKGLQLYYKSDKFEGIVYFNCIEFADSRNKVKDAYIIVNTELTDNNESHDDELTIIKTTTLRIKNTSITKTHLYPSDEYLSWKDWQYILFPKSVGAVVCGMENKYFYIINDTEMVDEEHHFVYNMNTDATLPLFSYADINKTKFKDIDCSEFIDKRTDAILFENNNIDDAIKSIKQENKIGNDIDYSDFNQKYIDTNLGSGEKFINVLEKRLSYCKNTDDIIKAISTMYGNDPVENNITRLNHNIWTTIITHMMKNGINAKPYGPKDFMEQVYSIISNNVTQITETEENK